VRSDWVPLSASALVIGAMSLVFGSLLNPSQSGDSTLQTLRVVEDDGGRWLAMAVMFFLASLALTLGLPTILTLLDRRGRKVGVVGLALFTVGAVGTCGFAMLMVFFRALVDAHAIVPAQIEAAGQDHGLSWFLYAWIGGFYGGVLLIAIGLFLSRTTPRWVPALLALFVLVLPVSSHLGRVGSAIQVMALAVAFTGIAMAAVSGESKRTLTHEPVF
jgi:MFS family permease